MQWDNDSETTIQQEDNEHPGYIHGYKPSSEQMFQQQAYYPPLIGQGPTSYGQHSQPQFVGNPPLSDVRFAAILSYSFGWLTGILFLLFGGKNRFVRFHALQSLVFFGTINVVDVGLIGIMREVADYSHIVMLVCLLLLMMLNFIAFVSWVVVMVQAARGTYFRLPFVGELVARGSGLNARPRW